MRQLIKMKKISEKVEATNFGIVEEPEGVRYLPYAQAILYNYFSAIETYPLKINSQNVTDAKNFIKLSLNLGGFPLCDPIYEEDAEISSAILKMIDLQK